MVRREKEPDKFDGKSVDWRDYVVHFEQTSRWNGWSQPEMAKQLCMSLRGPAQKLLGDAKQEELDDYNLVKEMLTRRFAPKERTTAYRVEFNSRTRNKNESLSDYGYALRRLVKLAYPEHDKTEDLAIDQFIKGLDNFELQKRVQFSHPSSLESAIAVAIEYEAFVGSARERDIRKPKEQQNEFTVQAIQKTNNKPCKDEKENSELANLSQTLMNCFQELGKRMDEINKSIPVKCSKCSRLGHNSSECRTPTCMKCKKLGHYARNCRTKSDESKQNQNDSENLNTQGLGVGPVTQS